MATYDRFIKENVAPIGAKGVGVFKGGSFVGSIDLGSLSHNYSRNPNYSFMACSDMHKTTDKYYGENNGYHAGQDLLNALDFVSGKVNFIAMTGDLTHRGESAELSAIKKAFESKGWTMGKTGDVYTCCGNHEMYGRTWNTDNNTGYGVLSTYWTAQTGMDKNTVITKLNDVFIFFSPNNCIITGSAFSGQVYSNDDIDWLYDTLETHKDKRCFVFMHFFFPKMSGNYGYPNPYYHYPMDAESERRLTMLLNKYRNAIWFSGHSHWCWESQGVADKNNERNDNANIAKNADTGYCVHLSSLGKPRKPAVIDGNGSYVDETSDGANVPPSEFAIVDVYDDCIIIKGVSWQNGSYKYLPIAHYKLDTPIVDIDNSDIDFGDANGAVALTDLSIPSYDASNIYGYVGSTLEMPIGYTYTTESQNVSISGNKIRFLQRAYNANAFTINNGSKNYTAYSYPRLEAFLTTDGITPVTNPQKNVSYKIKVIRYYNSSKTTYEEVDSNKSEYLALGCSNATIGAGDEATYGGTVTFTAAGTYNILCDFTSTASNYTTRCTLKVVIK